MRLYEGLGSTLRVKNIIWILNSGPENGGEGKTNEAEGKAKATSKDLL